MCVELHDKWKTILMQALGGDVPSNGLRAERHGVMVQTWSSLYFHASETLSLFKSIARLFQGVKTMALPAAGGLTVNASLSLVVGDPTAEARLIWLVLSRVQK